MLAVDLVILVVWVAFWAYWLAASVGAKAGHSRWRRCAGARMAIALIVLLLLRARVLRGHATRDPWLEGIGLAVLLSGLGVAVWARRCLGRNWGMPMSEKVDPELVTIGPYRKVRHPIYSGIILGMVGTALAISWYWGIAVVVLATYFVYSAVMEERYMVSLFPDAYPAYQRTTKMLVPFVF